MLHGDSEIILPNDFDHQAFHQPNSRKVTKIIPSMFEKKEIKFNK
jgi:3-hydroxy-3-methylglutaryl CoA synthase